MIITTTTTTKTSQEIDVTEIESVLSKVAPLERIKSTIG